MLRHLETLRIFQFCTLHLSRVVCGKALSFFSSFICLSFCFMSLNSCESLSSSLTWFSLLSQNETEVGRARRRVVSQHLASKLRDTCTHTVHVCTWSRPCCNSALSLQIRTRGSREYNDIYGMQCACVCVSVSVCVCVCVCVCVWVCACVKIHQLQLLHTCCYSLQSLYYILTFVKTGHSCLRKYVVEWVREGRRW